MGEAIVETVGGWWVLLAILVAVLGGGRLARIVVADEFPPSMWVRQLWTNWCVKHKHDAWVNLVHCWWCFTPWLMIAVIGWFALTFLAAWVAWTWWLFWGWLALSYVASIIISRDEPADGN